MVYAADSLEKLAEYATFFVQSLEKRKREAVVIGLKGDLGSGKTAFVQAVAAILGVKEEVTSPTFIIQKIYPIPEEHVFEKLVHIDAYRLDAPEELAKIGFRTLLQEEGALIFVEWPEKVSTLLPHHMRELRFRFVDETTREITYDEEEK